MRFSAVLLAFVGVVSGYQLGRVPARPGAATCASSAVTRVQPPQMLDIDTNTLIGVGTLVASLGGGIGLIAFVENAGPRRAVHPHSPHVARSSGSPPA